MEENKGVREKCREGRALTSEILRMDDVKRVENRTSIVLDLRTFNVKTELSVIRNSRIDVWAQRFEIQRNTNYLPTLRITPYNILGLTSVYREKSL